MNDAGLSGAALALLGDEAVALGALHAGLSSAYGYPGTPSTEILEYLLDAAAAAQDTGGGERFQAAWCANEKTALEAALGCSFAGKRALVTMKHVGLNVASDPFINSALLDIHGGLVIAVADDPGMHSSQNEQDSRFYAAFALVPCLEPRSQQEAYDMVRDAFDCSERFHVPVLLRLVTRLSHARQAVLPRPPRKQNPCSKVPDRSRWILLPAFARKGYAALIEKQAGLSAWAASCGATRLETDGYDRRFVVITAGLGGNYYEENLEDLAASRGGAVPARLHIGAYPLPVEAIRTLCLWASRVLVLEEGQPFIEERLRGILPSHVAVEGKLSGALPRTGELDPDVVRQGLGLAPRGTVLDIIRPALSGGDISLGVSSPADSFYQGLVARPPQLCQGCPHGDSFQVINKAVALLDGEPGHPHTAINADIGCYTLGALPPYSAPESVVCMGASIGMARGAAEAGITYALALIGDSTFLHSGMTAVVDALSSGVPMTLIILDNSTVAMTGCQATIVPSLRLGDLLRGLGVPPEHLVELEAKGQFLEENAVRLAAEMEYRGFSAVIFRRECLEAFRKRNKKERHGEV
jgi:indolepyruvate ferredoxin oxidoreductase alpha subunit